MTTATTTEQNVKALGIEDLHGDITTPLTYQRKGPTGVLGTVVRHAPSSANLPASAALVAALGLSPGAFMDAAFGVAVVGLATTTVSGKGKASDAQADPIFVTTNNAAYGRILSAGITAGITGAADLPSATNLVATGRTLQKVMGFHGSSGKDGYGQMGVIAASATAPVIASSSTSGNLTGTYTYKCAAYNLSGTIAGSSVSASTGAIVAKSVTLTLPALTTNAMGWFIYRSTDSITWYLVGTATNGVNFNIDGTLSFVDNNAYPNTAVTSPGADTTSVNATMSGRYDFITFTPGTGTITVPATGNTAGFLDIRIQQASVLSTAFTVTGVGAHAVNVGGFRRFTTVDLSVSTAGSSMFVGTSPLATSFVTSSACAQVTPSVFGLGSDCSLTGQHLAGFGTKGNASGGTGGNGGYGGAFVRIWGYEATGGTIGGTITVTGAAGSAGSGTGAQGGGGGAGGLIDIGMVKPWKDTGTRTASGGAGGASSGSGGAATVYGGGGGGGGAVIRRNCYDKTGATTAVAAGAAGANGTSATATVTNAACGGAHYGNAGVTFTASVAAATAGQQFDFTALNDPSQVFAA